MRCVILTMIVAIVLFVGVFCSAVLAAETGDLRIIYKPGIQIYLDDQVVGITAEQDGGLLVNGLIPGIYKVRGGNTEFGVSIEPGKATEIKVGQDGAPMVLIPAGEFQMGSNSNLDREKPIHTVYLDAFYMDKYEVTNAQYKKFMDATGRKAPKYWNDPNLNAPDHPVVGVSWYDAAAYAEWAGKRLPTETEWEKAARGGLDSKKYSWGNEAVADNANRNGMGGKDWWEYTAPVGSFAPNGYGLYDMAGNALEWCEDWSNEDYYSNSPRQNPQGPSWGTDRVLRGGSWLSTVGYIRCASRFNCNPMAPFNSFGFRCVAQAQK